MQIREKLLDSLFLVKQRCCFRKIKSTIYQNKEEGIKETIYTPNEVSILELAKQIEEQKYANYKSLYCL